MSTNVPGVTALCKGILQIYFIEDQKFNKKVPNSESIDKSLKIYFLS